MAQMPLENWVVKPRTPDPVDAVMEIVRWELSEEDTALRDPVAFKLHAMVGMTYERYAHGESAKTFYQNCCKHIGELYAAVTEHPSEMGPFSDCIVRLAHAMCQIDTETSVDEAPITAETPAEERLRVGDLLEADRKRFCNILADHLVSLQPYPEASVMFTEFARVIHTMNNYPPPPRTVHDAHKIPLDMKKEVDYFDEILENLEACLEPAAPPPARAMGEFECPECQGSYEADLGAPVPPRCPECEEKKEDND